MTISAEAPRPAAARADAARASAAAVEVKVVSGGIVVEELQDQEVADDGRLEAVVKGGQVDVTIVPEGGRLRGLSLGSDPLDP